MVPTYEVSLYPGGIDDSYFCRSLLPYTVSLLKSKQSTVERLYQIPIPQVVKNL